MKTFEGTVVSTKMTSTAVVEVVFKQPHPLYKKLIKKSRKYKVALGKEAVATGDMVRIQEVRPISKDKHFKIIKVIKKQEVI